MPRDLDLTGGYELVVTALDPSTGNVVSAVKVSALVITVVTPDTGDTGVLGFGPFLLVPGPGA